MANTYTPEQLKITTPQGGFQQGSWVQGRQYWDGTFSDPGVIHPSSNQQGAGQMVSEEVNRQSSIAQGLAPDAIQKYLTKQQTNNNPTSMVQPGQIAPGAAAPTSTDGGTGMPVAPLNPQVPDLTALYQNLYKDLGIADKEAKIAEAEKQYYEARNQISDNPFLSASSMDNRLRRLRQGYETETQPLQTQVATAKADLETQLNLQTKQFDINSQAAQQSLNQFNILLEAGALDNASGEDIASITRATGLSSGMIQAAVAANKQKNLSVSSYDDGENEYFIAVDPMGNIVNWQYVGPSGKGGSGSGGFDTGTFLQGLYGSQDAYNTDSVLFDTIVSEVAAPQFSPRTGTNTTYTDPATGITYQYTGGGWLPV